MDRSAGSPRTRSVVGVRGPGVSVFGLPTFFTHCFGHVFSKVGVRAIIGVTEFEAEFTGMLNLHERFDFIDVVVCFVKPV